MEVSKFLERILIYNESTGQSDILNSLKKINKMYKFNLDGKNQYNRKEILNHLKKIEELLSV